MQEKLIDAEELSKMLHVKQLHIYKLIDKGMPFYDISVGTQRKSYRFKWSEVEKWLAKNNTTQTEEEKRKKELIKRQVEKLKNGG